MTKHVSRFLGSANSILYPIRSPAGFRLPLQRRTTIKMIPADWTHPVHPAYSVSTRKELFDLSAINDALDSDMVYWGTRLPEDVLRKMLDNSLAFGVYRMNSDGSKLRYIFPPNAR